MGNYHCKSAPRSESASLSKEGFILCQLQNCPQVVRLLDYSFKQESTQTFKLYLEHVSGGTLANRIRKSVRGHMQEADVRRCTKSLLLGLYEVHKKGFVHRHLKPDYILLVSRYSNEVKIANFELAVRSGFHNWEVPHRSCYFMSPESVGRFIFYPPGDVWALGCRIVVMMTGNSPWNTWMSEIDVLFKLGHTDELPEIPDNLSMQGKDFLRKCFVRDPSKRWTAQMLLEHPFVEEEYHQDEEEGLIQSYNHYLKLKKSL